MDFVPERILKKRESEKLAAEKRVVAAKAARKVAGEKKHAIFNRAQNYEKEYAQAMKDEVRLAKQAKACGNIYVKEEPKVLFAIRIRGIIGVSPKVKKVLRLLRLRQIHNGVFLKNNKAIRNMLQIAEPFLAYGTLNISTVRKLVYKRGFGKLNRQRTQLNNDVIETALGAKDIICMEDLIHEIATCGENFKEANNFVWPFKLRSPKGGFLMKLLHFNEGGDAGNREHKLNDLVLRML
eukprot:TRINITY_DN751_c0_g1_i4.p1 TRINITY_DN751_c0_g1~~TRINITY_DN751_c0_g1_i4.p1  ORF type:complete len:249 (-),score=14.79 TRINITY_DN751_c0_g1_i4:167-880(-)